MFKKVLSLGVFLISSPLFANELTSFDAIVAALSSGKQVSAVLHAKQCKVTDPNEIKFLPSSGFVRIDSALFTEDKLGFDVTKYARAIPTIAPNGLMQRASFILEKNGQLNGVIASFDAVTNVKPANRKDVTVDCKLGDSVHFYLN